MQHFQINFLCIILNTFLCFKAIDFSLHDLSGKPYSLSELLEEKPVVLIWGMYTCPAYQGLGDYYNQSPFDQASYIDEYDVVENYHKQVTFVHLYGPEPHPIAPDSNFDQGTYRINYWSIVRQATSYDDRLEMATKISPNIHPESLLLPDYLPGNPYNGKTNSIWCSYASGARTAMLIGRNGEVLYTEDWFHKTNLSTAIEDHLAGREITVKASTLKHPQKKKEKQEKHAI
mmetsp:Transcript_7615/g.9906  ORF Transcript_7615/g.9906 Transcript_7615/m.9906 type:complete len:231 (+) Transcript_7615:323-1015(+)